MSKPPSEANDFYEFTDRFLKKNTHLFNIFGIFGATAVYLGTIATELSDNVPSIILDTGILTSLSLFVLVGGLINMKYKSEYERFYGDTILRHQKENIIPVLPIILFDTLLSSVVILVLMTLWASWISLLTLFLGGVTLHVTIYFIPYLSRQVDKYEWFPFENAMAFTTYSITIIYVLLCLFAIYFILPVLPEYAYQLIYIVMLMAGGGLVFILSIPIIYDME